MKLTFDFGGNPVRLELTAQQSAVLLAHGELHLEHEGEEYLLRKFTGNKIGAMSVKKGTAFMQLHDART